MIDLILRKYKSRGMFPYDNWASDPESFFLLQKLWLDIIEQSGVLVGYVADQEVIQQDGSYIISLRKENKRLVIYPLSSHADYSFDFYLKQVLDNNGNPMRDSVMLVLDTKLDAPYLGATVEIFKSFEGSALDSQSSQDKFYSDLFSLHGHLLAYNSDGSLKSGEIRKI